MKYKYETHLHTFPASKCGKATVFESLKFYKEAGYDGVFLTNHFIGGNIGCDHDLPIAEQLEFFFEDYYQSQVIGKELGLKVYPGVELSYQGTDFLIYGLEPEFYFSHPEFFDLDFTEKFIRNRIRVKPVSSCHHVIVMIDMQKIIIFLRQESLFYGFVPYIEGLIVFIDHKYRDCAHPSLSFLTENHDSAPL